MTTPKPTTSERSESKGRVDLKFPGFEVQFPATNRTVMAIVLAMTVAFTIVVPLCFYQVFNARPEALEQVGDIIGGRKPEKVSVRTDEGEVQTIEVCPPCPECEDYMCDCPACRECPAQVLPPPPPAVPSMVPADIGGGVER
jgi:hypothetical protein